MKVGEFNYDLPRELVAQRPLPERDAARLLVVNRAGGAGGAGGALAHRRIRDLPEILREGDLLVLNDTKVSRVALHGRRATGGRVEILLLGSCADGWRALLKCNTKVRADDRIGVDGADGVFRVLARREAKVRFLVWEGPGELADLLARVGFMPLPPYIKRNAADGRRAADRSRYQTVFARNEGAIAAPTAGLHFTRGLLERLKAKRIGTAQVTLTVGLGTFAPIECEDVADHPIHSEHYAVSPEAADAINEAKCEGRRIVAVGTTTTRVLESAWREDGLASGAGETDLYVYPPYEFQAVDALLTNFHLPRTSLLVMVSAFAGLPLIQRAYASAVEKKYRFYSYGDAMLID